MEVCVQVRAPPHRNQKPNDLMRESRKRKSDDRLRHSKEFIKYLRETPSGSTTSDDQKFETFLRVRAPPTPKSKADLRGSRGSGKETTDYATAKTLPNFKRKAIRYCTLLGIDLRKERLCSIILSINCLSSRFSCVKFFRFALA